MEASENLASRALHDSGAEPRYAPLTMADYRERLLSLGVEPQLMSPGEMKVYMNAEIAKFARVVAASGARAD